MIKTLRFRLSLGVLSCLFACTVLNAEEGLDEKIYVEQHQIHVAKEVVEVELNDGLYATDMLYNDEKGYYVLSSRLTQEKKIYECDICGWECDGYRAFQEHMREYH